jgi:hypothetical protein
MPPFMRRRGAKHVSRELLFFGVSSGHGGVQPGAGVAPAAVGGEQGDVQALGRLPQRQAGQKTRPGRLALTACPVLG